MATHQPRHLLDKTWGGWTLLPEHSAAMCVSLSHHWVQPKEELRPETPGWGVHRAGEAVGKLLDHLRGASGKQILWFPGSIARGDVLCVGPRFRGLAVPRRLLEGQPAPCPRGENPELSGNGQSQTTLMFL